MEMENKKEIIYNNNDNSEIIMPGKYYGFGESRRCCKFILAHWKKIGKRFKNCGLVPTFRINPPPFLLLILLYTFVRFCIH